jgi:VWFA-related protein
MKRAIHVATLILLARIVFGQVTPTTNEPSKSTIRSTSTLVTVPTLVRSLSGQPVTDLDASHFRLSDNGIEQNVSVDQAENQPLAVVIVMQTGGAASDQLLNFGRLDIMLERILESSTHKVALVTFDSRPEQIWNFPPIADALDYFLTHPKAGDRGAAIMDAVNCAIGLLQAQPARFRRVVLLLGQEQDDGSKSQAEDVVRDLADSGVTIHGLIFSPEKAGLRRHLAKPLRTNPTSQEKLPFDEGINPSTSMGAVFKAMHENTAEELATLSGGEHLRFSDEGDLERRLSMLTYDIHHGYTLIFRPSSHDPGLHTLRVHVVNQQTRVAVKARKTYWSDSAATEK